jgi:hypothetical protein
MKTTLTLIFSLLLSFLPKANACSCVFIPTFCETITYNNNGQIWDQLSIYQVRMVTKTPNGVNAFISETYAGENLTGHTVFILDGGGWDCILPVNSFFELGKSYIVAANRTGDTLSVSICGVTWLPVKNGKVTGDIAPGISSLPLSEFPKIANCGDLLPAEELYPGVLDGIVVRPTLATESVQVKTTSPFQADMRLSVYDTTGRLLLRSDYPAFNFYSNVFVDLAEFSEGVYFLHAEVEGEQKAFKVLKVNGG